MLKWEKWEIDWGKPGDGLWRSLLAVTDGRSHGGGEKETKAQASLEKSIPGYVASRGTRRIELWPTRSCHAFDLHFVNSINTKCENKKISFA